MNTQLIFKSHTLEAITQSNQIWLASKDIAMALGYAKANAVTKIYNQNTDEFTAGMTDIAEVPDLGTSGNLKVRNRIFSLRGAHLIAMFARTSIAKEFRKWVLDILDCEIQQSSTVIAPHRECLPKMVYHHQSKYNPYSAYAWDGKKSVYIGVYPTVDEAVSAQQHYYKNGSTKRIQKIKSGLSATEQDLFIGNLHAILHNFRRIDEIWRSKLRPALDLMDSKLVYLLHDRFNDSMCVLPTIEDRIGRYTPPTLPR